MKPATEALLNVAFALTPEENWTWLAWARTEAGWVVDSKSPRASSWCPLAALELVPCSFDARCFANQALCEAIGHNRVTSWNDHPNRTHKQVLAALYKAAAIAEGL